MGIFILVLCSIVFVGLFTNLINFWTSFLLGTLGLFSYPFWITAFIVGIALINNKKYIISAKYVVFFSLTVLSLLCIIQLIVVKSDALSYTQFLTQNYTQKLTAGGVIVGFVAGTVKYVLNLTAAYIIFSLTTIIFGALMADYFYNIKKNPNFGIKRKDESKFKTEFQMPKIIETKQNENNHEKINVTLDGYLESQPKDLEAKRKLGIIASSAPKPILLSEDKKPMSKREYILTPQSTLSSTIFGNAKVQKTDTEPFKPIISNEEINNTFNQLKQTQSQIIQPQTQSINNISNIQPIKKPLSAITDEDDYTKNLLKDIMVEEKTKVINKELPKFTEDSLQNDLPEKKLLNILNFSSRETMYAPVELTNVNEYEPIIYNPPPLDLLTTQSIDISSLNENVVEKRAQLENSLATFGIPAKVIGVVVGPAITRYELEMPPGIAVKRVLSHADDIALSLASNGNIRIEAPIPGRSAVGVEVPNEKVATVSIKEILTSREFLQSRSPLTMALGKDISGAIKITTLPKLTHLLVAGTTNSGKSVCLNSIILSFIFKASPEEVRLILIDPKFVEFNAFNGLPHLLIPKVITDAEKAINALSWAVSEMDKRFRIFESTMCLNIDDYNSSQPVISNQVAKMPYIVIIIDELNELLMCAKKELEEKIARLSQKARACGIHLIFATQRPSVDVITGTIKANLPSRIAFSLKTQPDSKTVLGEGGAEKLLGRGDMLYSPNGSSEPKRIQGCFVSSEEINMVVNYIKANNKCVFDEQIERAIMNPNQKDNNIGSESNEVSSDPMFISALRVVVETGQTAVTFIQRKLMLGFPRAARLLDQMEAAGYLSGQDASKQREVIITMEQFENLYGNTN